MKPILPLFALLILAPSARGSDPTPTGNLSVNLSTGALIPPKGAGSISLGDPAFGGTLPSGALPPSTLHDYRVDAALIDTLIAGKSAGNSTEALFSAANDTTHVYTRNPSLWCAGIDLTCISAAASHGQGAGWHVTAIAPSFGVTATHITTLGGNNLAVGDSLWYVDANNNTVVTTIAALTQIGASDLTLVTYGTPLPASITPAQILPGTLPPGFTFAGCPVFYTNQARNANVAEIVSLGASATLQSAIASNRVPWTTAGPGVYGDSSSPYGMFLGGKFVLLGTFFVGTGSGPDIGQNAATLLSAMGSGSALNVANLPGYPAQTLSVGAVTQVPQGAGAALTLTQTTAGYTIGLSYPNGTLLPLATPSNPTVVGVGTPLGNSISYGYQIAALQANGSSTAASGYGLNSSGPMTLSSGSYNAVTWNVVPGAYSYAVYRSYNYVYTLVGTVLATPGATTGTVTYNDIGGGTTVTTVPSVNNTGRVDALGGGSIGTGTGLLKQVAVTGGYSIVPAVAGTDYLPSVVSTTTAYAATVTPALGTSGADLVLDIGTLTGALTIANPVGTFVNRQRLAIHLQEDSTGGRAVTYGTAYHFTAANPASSFTTAANALYPVLFEYWTRDSAWHCVGATSTY